MPFSVLPVSVLKTEYKFSLPPASSHGGFHTLYFLSVQDSKVHLKMFSDTEEKDYEIELKVCCNLLLINVCCRKKTLYFAQRIVQN